LAARSGARSTPGCSSAGGRVKIMSRGLAKFTQGDVTKALKAAKEADLPIASYEIDREGKIVVLIGKPKGDDNLPPGDTDENDFGG
jgi:hypothetical protein